MMRASLPGSAMRSALYLILLVFSIFYLVPLYVMLVNSFKELDEIRSGAMLALPDNFTLAPWESAWSTAQIGVSPTGLKPYFINSIAMVIPAVLISTLIGAINGYVLSKWQFRGHRWVFGLLLFSCFIPFQIVLIPMAKTLGILGIASLGSDGAYKQTLRIPQNQQAGRYEVVARFVGSSTLAPSLSP